MNDMICTSCWGSRSRSRPSSSSCGSVVAARVRLASTPRVPLISSAMPASRPCWLTLTPSTSVCGPVATNGSSTAKRTNGTSTTARLSRYVGGTREMTTTTAMSRK